MELSPLDHFIIDRNIIGVIPEAIQLKSGRSSYFYVNWRIATNDAYWLDILTDLIVSFLKKVPVDFDTILGIAEGATKTSVITAFKWAKQSPSFSPGSHLISMERSVEKSHGATQDRYFIGPPKGRVLLFEDTVTTGGSVISTIKKLQKLGVPIAGVLCLTDRCQKNEQGLSAEDAIADACGAGIPLFALSRAPDLLKYLDQKEKFSDNLRTNLTLEFKNHGITSIDWKLT